MSLDVMKQALEALEQYTNVVTSVNDPNSWVTVSDGGKPARDAIAALRAAIEQAQEPVAWILEWIEDGEVYASKLYESERRCRYDAKKDTNAVCRPLVYGDKLKEKNNG